MSNILKGASVAPFFFALNYKQNLDLYQNYLSSHSYACGCIFFGVSLLLALTLRNSFLSKNALHVYVHIM
ncbi:hypothetical protein VCRA2119O146_600002 [Vibrio crassostreae]|nr:hypothetical protein VCRA2119O146_600002 [Vibrio crassostreae]